MHLWTKPRLGKPARRIAILPHHHRDLQPPRNQQRFISEVSRQPTCLHLPHPTRLSSISPRKHVKSNPPSPQQLSQQNHKRSLPRPARGNVPHTNHRSLQLPRWQPSAVIQPVTRRNSSRINRRPPIDSHACARSRSSSSAVRAVAPVCDRNVSNARCPSAFRLSSSPSNSSNTSGSSAGPTIRTALRL